MTELFRGGDASVVFPSRVKFSLVLFSPFLSSLGVKIRTENCNYRIFSHSPIEPGYLSGCNYRGWLIRLKFGKMGWKSDSTRVGGILDLFFCLFKDENRDMFDPHVQFSFLRLFRFRFDKWSNLSFWLEMNKKFNEEFRIKWIYITFICVIKYFFYIGDRGDF